MDRSVSSAQLTVAQPAKSPKGVGRVDMRIWYINNFDASLSASFFVIEPCCHLVSALNSDGLAAAIARKAR